MERDALSLKGSSDYALLVSSSCYYLPPGPFSNDGIAMDDMWDAFRSFSFKSKHYLQCFGQYSPPQKHQVWRGRCPGHLSLCHQHASASKAARQLGVLAVELAKTLTYKTIYTQETLHCAAECKLECSTEGPAHVWPLCYLMANYNLAPRSQAPLCSATQIMLLDPAGFHLLSLLIWVASIILLQLHQ